MKNLGFKHQKKQDFVDGSNYHISQGLNEDGTAAETMNVCVDPCGNSLYLIIISCFLCNYNRL